MLTCSAVGSSSAAHVGGCVDCWPTHRMGLVCSGCVALVGSFDCRGCAGRDDSLGCGGYIVLVGLLDCGGCAARGCPLDLGLPEGSGVCAIMTWTPFVVIGGSASCCLLGDSCPMDDKSGRLLWGDSAGWSGVGCAWFLMPGVRGSFLVVWCGSPPPALEYCGLSELVRWWSPSPPPGLCLSVALLLCEPGAAVDVGFDISGSASDSGWHILIISFHMACLSAVVMSRTAPRSTLIVKAPSGWCLPPICLDSCPLVLTLECTSAGGAGVQSFRPTQR